MRIKGPVGCLLGLLILGAVALGIWAAFHGRVFAEGSVPLSPRQFYSSAIEASKAAKLVAEVIPDGVTSPSDPYEIFVLDQNAARQLNSHLTRPESVSKLYDQSTSGSFTTPPIPVEPGTYEVFIYNPGPKNITLHYNFREVH